MFSFSNGFSSIFKHLHFSYLLLGFNNYFYYIVNVVFNLVLMFLVRFICFGGSIYFSFQGE